MQWIFFMDTHLSSSIHSHNGFPLKSFFPLYLQRLFSILHLFMMPVAIRFSFLRENKSVADFLTLLQGVSFLAYHQSHFTQVHQKYSCHSLSSEVKRTIKLQLYTHLVAESESSYLGQWLLRKQFLVFSHWEF